MMDKWSEEAYPQNITTPRKGSGDGWHISFQKQGVNLEAFRADAWLLSSSIFIHIPQYYLPTTTMSIF